MKTQVCKSKSSDLHTWSGLRVRQCRVAVQEWTKVQDLGLFGLVTWVTWATDQIGGLGTPDLDFTSMGTSDGWMVVLVVDHRLNQTAFAGPLLFVGIPHKSPEVGLPSTNAQRRSRPSPRTCRRRVWWSTVPIRRHRGRANSHHHITPRPAPDGRSNR